MSCRMATDKRCYIVMPDGNWKSAQLSRIIIMPDGNWKAAQQRYDMALPDGNQLAM
mgnify:FL=1